MSHVTHCLYEFGTCRLCEQRRFRRACASAQSRQNLRCSHSRQVPNSLDVAQFSVSFPDVLIKGYVELKGDRAHMNTHRSFKVDEKATIRNRYNRISHPGQDIKKERNKVSMKYKTAQAESQEDNSSLADGRQDILK